jgi:hypothetical protein
VSILRASHLKLTNAISLFISMRSSMPRGPCKQCATPPRRRCQVSWATPYTYLAQTHFRKTDARQKLSISNKLLIYKTILKPIWTYGIQLWGTAFTSIIEILQRCQSKALRVIVDAPWYVLNTVIQRDLQIPTVKERPLQLSIQCSPQRTSK